MSTIQESIDVEVPVQAAYDQWTQFETFPSFMEGVESIEQLTDTTNRWTVEVGGARRVFTTEIVQQEPDRVIAWRTIEGDTGHDGTVRFMPVDGATTRIAIDMEVKPEGFVEEVGDKLGFISRRVRGDMRRFKEFVEARGAATGGWRGQV